LDAAVDTVATSYTGSSAATTVMGWACTAGLNCPSSSPALGRLAGFRLRHRRTVSTNNGGMLAVNDTVSERASGHEGGC